MKKTPGHKNSLATASGRRKKSTELGEEADKQRRGFLKTELDLSFTFTTVAITAYASGSLEHARQAARDAQKGLEGAQRQFAKAKLSAESRQQVSERLNHLQQVLATLRAKDPGVFGNHNGERSATSTLSSKVSRPK